MSMITSCPACGTMFRVVPDQLKISEGWVRCGHCAEVFDASAHLADESLLEAPLAEDVMLPAGAPTAELDTQPGDLLPTQPAELPTRPVEPPARSAEPPVPPVEPPARPPEPPARPAETSLSDSSSFFGTDSEALEPSPLDAPFVFRHSDLVRRDHDSSLLPPEPGEEVHIPPEEEEEDEAALRRVSFVRQARRRAWWRRPLVRILLALVSLGLAALLLLQVAYQDRDRLAFAQPALRPALERMCEHLGCRLGAPRQIDAIVIESSGFNRLRNDTYRLSFTLRNTARVPVALPAIELTVTDAQDQPIARKVIGPSELGAGQAIAPGSDWSRAVGVVVEAPPAARVAGYRVLAFYP